MTLPKKRDKTNLPARRVAKPNALKHGVFSSIEILPWEDPDLFEELRRDLSEEHRPEGPSQEDCVETILKCRWRKMRLHARRQFETSAALEKAENHAFRGEPPPLFDTSIEGAMHSLKNRSHEKHQSSSPDEYTQLLSCSASFYRHQDRMKAQWSVRFLPKEYRQHLEKHVPESNFETTEMWIVAIKNQIDTVLLPLVRGRRPKPSDYKAAAAEFLAADRMLEDLEIEDRLDASMDRALRRLFWLKTQKELEREKAQKLINGKAAPRPS